MVYKIPVTGHFLCRILMAYLALTGMLTMLSLLMVDGCFPCLGLNFSICKMKEGVGPDNTAVAFD